MGIIEKVGIGALVLAFVGGLAWAGISKIQSQAEQIGVLEANQAQLEADLKDSEASAEAVRKQLEMWQWLYADLQEGYDSIREDRQRMNEELNALRQEENVEAYLECPMPDSLYDWVRNN